MIHFERSQSQCAALDRPNQLRILQDKILAPHGTVGSYPAVQGNDTCQQSHGGMWTRPVNDASIKVLHLSFIWTWTSFEHLKNYKQVGDYGEFQM